MDNVETIRRLEEAWASNDFDTVRQIISPDFTNGGTGAEMMPPGGLEGVILGAQRAIGFYTEKHQELLEIFGDADKVVSRVRMTATNSGTGIEWAGIPANGKPIDIEWITIYTLKDGMVVRTDGVMDVAALLRQVKP